MAEALGFYFLETEACPVSLTVSHWLVTTCRIGGTSVSRPPSSNREPETGTPRGEGCVDVNPHANVGIAQSKTAEKPAGALSSV